MSSTPQDPQHPSQAPAASPARGQGASAAGRPEHMTEATTSAPRSSYAMGTVANMLRSLLAILVIVGGMLLLLPRVSSVSRPAVDVHPVAVDVARSTGWPISEPQGLPAGWTPTVVRFLRSTDGLQVWHVGYQTPQGDYLAVEQTMGATDAWVRAQTQRAGKAGTLTAAGRTWQKYDRDDKVQRTIVDKPAGTGRLTTIVNGTASFAELTRMAEALRPVKTS